MRLRAALRILAIVTSLAAAIVLAGSIALLVADYLDARRRMPSDKEKLASLEVAVRTDAAQTAVLNAEYERQREETFDRRDRRDLYTGFLIASAIIFLITAKWLVALKGPGAPTLVQVEAHRGAHRARAGRPHPLLVTVNVDAAESAPATPGAPAIDLSFVDRVVAEEGTSKEAAIAILQRIQTHYRYLPDAALERVCELTDVSPAQISGVSTFYAQFRRSPVGKYIIKVCHGTACHVSGASEITDEVRRHLKIPAEGDTDPDRIFTVDEVACVGCCSLAPVLMIEDETVGGLTPTSASEVIEVYRQEQNR